MKFPKLPPGDLSRRNRALIAMLPWKIVRLRDLELHEKKALIAHGIWPRPLRKEAEEDPERFCNRVFGRRKVWGKVFIPIELMKLQVMNDPDRRNDFNVFEEYHAYYKRVEKVPKHPKTRRWPIFPSGRNRERETILDGWHRFHSYVDSGAQEIPILWYADE